MIRSKRCWSCITCMSFVSLVSLAPAPLYASSRPTAPVRSLTTGSTMARIPTGSYRPLYATPGKSRIQVRSFALDRTPVTRGAYLRFVAAHPQWARGAVRPHLADAGYLADWPSGVRAGVALDLHRPVTGVSWHAASAYCTAQGKRLPTTDEWELAAAASDTKRDASGDQQFRRTLAAMYTARRPGVPAAVGRSFTNVYGVSDLHGVVWEWTADFNATVAGEAHHAGHRTGHPAAAGSSAERHLYCASSAIGAADPTDYPAFARSAMRNGLTARSTVSGVGFRCAANQPI